MRFNSEMEMSAPGPDFQERECGTNREPSAFSSCHKRISAQLSFADNRLTGSLQGQAKQQQCTFLVEASLCFEKFPEEISGWTVMKAAVLPQVLLQHCQPTQRPKPTLKPPGRQLAAAARWFLGNPWYWHHEDFCYNIAYRLKNAEGVWRLESNILLKFTLMIPRQSEMASPGNPLPLPQMCRCW